MALINCPECGKEISDSVKKCIHCGAKIKKRKPISKKVVLIILCIIIMVAGLVVFYFFSPRTVKWFCNHHYGEATCTIPQTCSRCGKQIGESLGHDWKDATCTEAKMCRVCGESEGEPTGHIWIDASCIEPKHCSGCELTEGEALGHDCEIGICSRCNEYIADLIFEFEDILTDTLSAGEYVRAGYDAANSYAAYLEDYYYNYQLTNTYFGYAKKEMDSVIRKCGDHKEFANIKKYITDWKNSIPTECKNDSYDEVQSYTQKLNKFLTVSKELQTKISDEAGKLIREE